MPSTYSVMLSLSELRPAVTAEVELSIAIGVFDSPGSLRFVTPPKGITVALEQRGRGRLDLPAQVMFPGGTSEIRIRVRPLMSGNLDLRASSTYQPPGSRVLSPPPIRGRIPNAYIAPVLPIPAAGACTLGAAAPGSATERWRNWHGNIRKNVRVSAPGTLQELVAAIQSAERAGARIGVEGSGWSFSNCVVAPDTAVVLRTENLRGELSSVLPAALHPSLSGSARRFHHVEAGMKIHQLNCALSAVGQAMPSLGGSRGQSIAGVIGTGVHGSNVDQAPIADSVCAIHLVGPGGQEWWIEPETDHITNPLAMQALRADGTLCANIRIVYSDDLFNSVLVSMGCAGVIYSLVLRARTAFRLQTTTSNHTWGEMRSYINTRIVTGRNLPVYAEINFNTANGSCILTERVRSPRMVATDRGSLPPPSNIATIAFAIGLLGPIGFATFLAAVGDYIARTTAEIAAKQSVDLVVPGLGSYLSASAMQEALDTVVEANELLGRLGLAAVDPHNEDNIASLLPVAVNLIWKIGFFVVEGRRLVDLLQSEITKGQRPEGVSHEPSYVAMTGQPLCPADGTQTHPATERLVESFEYAIPASRAVEFTERIHAIVRELRQSPDALIVNVNLRFTRASRALLAMQQFDRTAHLEIYTFRGMDGNSRFHRRLFDLAREFRAIPHWGQLHEAAVDATTLFGEKLAVWQWAMNHIATSSAGDPTTFWTAFARERGLLNFAPGVRMHPAVMRAILRGAPGGLFIRPVPLMP